MSFAIIPQVIRDSRIIIITTYYSGTDCVRFKITVHSAALEQALNLAYMTIVLLWCVIRIFSGGS